MTWVFGSEATVITSSSATFYGSEESFTTSSWTYGSEETVKTLRGGREYFNMVIAQIEEYDGIQTVSDHVCEPGMDVITSPMNTIIEELEKT